MDENLKKRRRLSYRLNQWDDVDLGYEVNFNNIYEQVIEFFHSGSSLVYPAKSYFVAVIYASCMERFFQKDFYESLDDVELLPDDPYFIPYGKSPELYNRIIYNIKDSIWKYDSINTTVNYFKKEFLLEKGDLLNGTYCKTNWKM